MGASTDDMINQLQASIAQPPQPSLFGIQAPQDPNTLKALLAHLQQQKYLSTVGQTGGQYGYLHDAGQSALANVGQQLGNAAGGALTQPPPGAPPAPPSQQQQMSGAVMQAQQAYQAQVAAGVDENTARTNATKMLVAAGVPGAADVLQKAQATGLDNQFKTAETAKDTSQGKMDDASIEQKKREADQNTWQTIKETPEYTIQKNALGEVRSVKVSDRASLPPSAAEIADMQDNAKKVANYQMSISDFLARKSGPDRQSALKEVYAANPDYNAGNYTGSQAAYKTFTSGKLGDQARFATNVAAHSLALEKSSDALQKGDLPAANAIAQEVGKQTGDPSITSYEVLQDIVAKEGVKALVPNAGSGAERAAAEARYKAALAGAQLKANTAALRGAVGVQYNNLKNQYEQTTYRKNFSDVFPWPGADATGKAPEPSNNNTPPAAGADGWTTMPNGVRVRAKQ